MSEMLHSVSLFSLCQLLHRPHLNVTNLQKAKESQFSISKKVHGLANVRKSTDINSTIVSPVMNDAYLNMRRSTQDIHHCVCNVGCLQAL